MKKLLTLVALSLVIVGSLAAQTFNDDSQWASYDDSASGGSSKITKQAAMETINGKEALGIAITGSVTTKYQYGFIGVAATPSPDTLTFMKTAKGITFMAVGDGQKYRVKVVTSDITDFDTYGKEFTAPKGKAITVTIPYSTLAQEGWGAKRKLTRPKSRKSTFRPSVSRSLPYLSRSSVSKRINNLYHSATVPFFRAVFPRESP